MRATVTDTQLVEEFVDRARSAQERFERFGQAQVDDVVTGAAWAGYSNADYLARLSVEETQIGVVEDKATKNRRKTLGTLRDLRGAKSVGVIHMDRQSGITEIAKPVGVVAALTPLTNPAATPINNIMITLKGRNAVILAPHPKAERTCEEVVRLVHHELAKLGVPLELVQLFSLQAPDKEKSKQRANELMRQVDIVLATTGPPNVRAAYQSGVPALGVGLGNVPVIVDSSADIDDAADKIVHSKTFDNATSCSSENALVVAEEVYANLIEALRSRGGYLVSASEKASLQETMWQEGVLSRQVVAQPAKAIAALAGIDAGDTRFLIVEEEGIGPRFPFSGEKLSPVLTVYRFTGFERAVEIVNTILNYQGLGHSCGIHTKDEERINRIAEATKVARVLVNQAHCVGNGGDFANGLPFTLSMGAGTWGRNSTCDNITYRHFLNITRIARPIPAVIPTADEMFGDYLRQH
jgi:sulfoacetaldehyde dehydrogenase